MIWCMLFRFRCVWCGAEARQVHKTAGSGESGVAESSPACRSLRQRARRRPPRLHRQPPQRLWNLALPAGGRPGSARAAERVFFVWSERAESESVSEVECVRAVMTNSVQSHLPGLKHCMASRLLCKSSIA